MIQKLQYRNAEWDDKITEEDIIHYKNGSRGYILEVDVEYPIAPEVKNVKANMLSDKQAEIYKQIKGSKEPKDEKPKIDIELK